MTRKPYLTSPQNLTTKIISKTVLAGSHGTVLSPVSVIATPKAASFDVVAAGNRDPGFLDRQSMT